MIEVGKTMHWHKVVSNYGHEHVIQVKVLKVGKRITVEAPMRRGGTRKTCVTPERLHEIPTTWEQMSNDDVRAYAKACGADEWIKARLMRHEKEYLNASKDAAKFAAEIIRLRKALYAAKFAAEIM